MSKDNSDGDRELPKIQRIISVAWPSFLMAGLATIIFFTLFDPDVFLTHTRFAGTSRLSAYSSGFFSFWALTFLSCCLTCYFRKSCKDCSDLTE